MSTPTRPPTVVAAVVAEESAAALLPIGAAAVAGPTFAEYDGREWLTRRSGSPVLEALLTDRDPALPRPPRERTPHRAHR